MVQLALVGTGKWGTQYLQTVREMTTCKITYVCSPHIFDKDFPDDYVRVADFTELMNKNDIDGVILATPPQTHTELASYCIRRSIPVLIEKPFALSLSDAEMLAAISKEYNAVVIVGHVYLYHPAYRALKQLRKTLGKTFLVRSSGGRFDTSASWQETLWEWGPHDISMYLDFVGKMPTNVSAFSYALGKRINIHVHLKDNNGFVGDLTFGTAMPGRTRLFTVIGEKGHAIFDDTKENKVAVHASGHNSVVYPTYSALHPLEVQIKEFVTAIHERKPTTKYVVFASSVIRILHAAELSLRKKGRQYVIIQ